MIHPLVRRIRRVAAAEEVLEEAEASVGHSAPPGCGVPMPGASAPTVGGFGAP